MANDFDNLFLPGFDSLTGGMGGLLADIQRAQTLGLLETFGQPGEPPSVPVTPVLAAPPSTPFVPPLIPVAPPPTTQIPPVVPIRPATSLASIGLPLRALFGGESLRSDLALSELLDRGLPPEAETVWGAILGRVFQILRRVPAPRRIPRRRPRRTPPEPRRPRRPRRTRPAREPAPERDPFVWPRVPRIPQRPRIPKPDPKPSPEGVPPARPVTRPQAPPQIEIPPFAVPGIGFPTVPVPVPTRFPPPPIPRAPPAPGTRTQPAPSQEPEPAPAGQLAAVLLPLLLAGLSPATGSPFQLRDLTQFQRGRLELPGQTAQPQTELDRACRERARQRRKKRKCLVRYNVAWTGGPNKGRIAGSRCFRFGKEIRGAARRLTRRATREVGAGIAQQIQRLF